MGIDANVVKLLLVARNRGASLKRTLMIGRQELCIDERALRQVLASFGIQTSAAQVAGLYAAADGYVEPLLRLLGAERVESLDASAFEGASLIHDMNHPVPDQWKSAFTLVIDGGSLEHVFAFPTAIRNCMELVAVGGHFLGISPTNNYTGHGFYQFSPELYFRLFTPDNGFRLDKLVVFRRNDPRWYAVTDPAQAGRRVTLANNRPTLMATLAEKISELPPTLRAPQQSDYSSQWNEHEATGSPNASRRDPRPGDLNGRDLSHGHSSHNDSSGGHSNHGDLIQRGFMHRPARRRFGRSRVRRLLVAMKQAWRGGLHPKFYTRDRSGDGLPATDR
jgi:hypothetical protein